MKNLIIIAFLISFPSGYLHAQTGELTGVVLDKETMQAMSFVTVVLLPTHEEYHTDQYGTFHFQHIAPGNYALQVVIEWYPDTIIEQINIEADSSVTLSITFEFPPCKYGDKENSEEMLKRSCPVCHNRENTIPITYGLPGEELVKEAKSGRVHLGGCSIEWCMPYWYCKQDKVKY